MRLIDIKGLRYGRLLVIKKMPPRKDGGSEWQCICDCGRQHTAQGSSLRNGSTTSCGCAAREWAASMGANPEFIAKRAIAMQTHGHKRRGSTTAEYRTWLAIKRRCYSPSFKDYANWGGRGIQVCDEWRSSFETFLNDMGLRPAGRYSIDRLDPNGHYHPGNCRWATATQQGGENKRSLVPVAVNGVEFPSLAVAARHFGVDVAKAWCRVNSGVPPELAVSVVGRLKRPRPRESYLRKDRR